MTCDASRIFSQSHTVGLSRGAFGVGVSKLGHLRRWQVQLRNRKQHRSQTHSPSTPSITPTPVYPPHPREYCLHLHNHTTQSAKDGDEPECVGTCLGWPLVCGKLTCIQHQRQRPGAHYARKQAPGCLHHGRSTSLPLAEHAQQALSTSILIPIPGPKPHRLTPDCRRGIAVQWKEFGAREHCRA